MLHLTLAKLVLVIASFLLITSAGIGLYQGFVVMPTWFQNPPASFERINQNGTAETIFWIVVQAATVLSVIVALVLNWSVPERRMFILIALACYIIAAISSAAFFAPKIIAWGAMNPSSASSPELITAVGKWLALSWAREGVLLVGSLSLLVALAL